MRTSLPRFETAHLSVGREDRVTISRRDDRSLLIVADGSGGTRGGAKAAEFVVRFLIDHFDEMDLLALVRECDLALVGGGQSTVVLAVIDSSGVNGVSAGDSEAWLIAPRTHRVLTENQERKPLLGSGDAIPIPFGAPPFEGTLLLGSDGLFKYAKTETLLAIARSEDLQAIPKMLVDSVRLRSGALQDDCTALVCRGVYYP